MIRMYVQVWEHCSKSRLLDYKTSESFPTLTQEILSFFPQSSDMALFLLFCASHILLLTLACLQQPWFRELLHQAASPSPVD